MMGPMASEWARRQRGCCRLAAHSQRSSLSDRHAAVSPQALGGDRCEPGESLTAPRNYRVCLLPGQCRCRQIKVQTSACVHDGMSACTRAYVCARARVRACVRVCVCVCVCERERERERERAHIKLVFLSYTPSLSQPDHCPELNNFGQQATQAPGSS